MTRVGDQLGTGASFARARGGVSARRQAVAATAGAATAGAADSRLRALPVKQLVPTRFNPRRSFGTEEEQREFGLKLKKKQLQPAVAVTRDAYLALWPDETINIGTAPYVIANGERRWRGARAASLPTLDVVVDDEVAKSRADFLDAVLSENNDRENLDPVEQALGIRTMVEQLGGKAKVAEYYGKSAGWVTQQMYLLDLAPELQDLVGSGELPLRETRELAKLPTDEQVDAWRVRHAEREQLKAQPRKRRTRPAGDSEKSATSENEPSVGFTAVKNTPEPTPQQRNTLPHQASGNEPTTRSSPADAPSSGEAQTVGAIAELAAYVDLARDFAGALEGLPTAYAAAAQADAERAMELASRLHVHMRAAAERLPRTQ